MKTITRRILLVIICLAVAQPGYCQGAGVAVPAAAARPSATMPVRPAHLRFLRYEGAGECALVFDAGKPRERDTPLKGSAQRLFTYFLTGISLPDDAFWVNLRPDAPQDIIDPLLAKTECGRIFLEADLRLKQDVSRYSSPCTVEGKEYWRRLYEKAELLQSSGSIPTLCRPWIVPGEVILMQDGTGAYVYKACLDIRLMDERLSGGGYDFGDRRAGELNRYASQLMRELVVPKLVREINSSSRYADLRQVYYSLVLAQWFKRRFKGGNAGLPARIDSLDLSAVASEKPCAPGSYFSRYRESFNKGEYRSVEQVSTPRGGSVRTYTSGGMALGTVFSGISDGAFDREGIARDGRTTVITTAAAVKPGGGYLVFGREKDGGVTLDGYDGVPVITSFLAALEANGGMEFRLTDNGRPVLKEVVEKKIDSFSASLPFDLRGDLVEFTLSDSGRRRKLHLGDFISELVKNSYDAVLSYYDPELKLKPPVKYHGKANVAMRLEDGFLRMVFTDNGAGAGAASIQSKKSRNHRGYDNDYYFGGEGNATRRIKRFAEELGGSFEYDYANSTVVLRIPFSALALKRADGGNAVEARVREALEKFIREMRPAGERNFFVARDGERVAQGAFLEQITAFSKTLPIEITRRRELYPLDALMRDYAGNGYDAVMSYYDSGLGLTPPKGYEGSVTVSLSLTGDSNDILKIVFRDTGAGLRSADTKRKRESGELYAGGIGGGTRIMAAALRKLGGSVEPDYARSRVTVLIPLRSLMLKTRVEYPLRRDGWLPARIGENSPDAVKGNAPGGIDLRAIPSIPEPLSLAGRDAAQGHMTAVIIEKELAAAETMIAAGIRVSGSRITDVAASCLSDPRPPDSLARIQGCIASVLRLDEDAGESSEPELVQLLWAVGSNEL